MVKWIWIAAFKIGQNLDSGKGYGIATPPGSSLRDSINLAVLELKEKNKIPEFYEFWWKNKSQCLHTIKNEVKYCLCVLKIVII